MTVAPLPHPRKLVRYSLALAAVLAAMATRLLLEEWVGRGLPTYITFYPFVMLTLTLGSGPAALTTVLSSAAAAYWLLPPAGLAVASPADRLGLAIFTATSLIACWLAGVAHRHRLKAIALDHETALRESHNRELLRAKEEWELTFDSVPDLISIMDENHRIVRANRAMAERLGVSPGECVGQACYLAVHGAGHPLGNCPHVLTIADGRQHQAEVHEDRLGGDFLVTTTPLRDARGKMTGTVHVARDITERKKTEMQIQQHLEELQARNDELTRFIKASAGRELRMIELKKEINGLCERAGLPLRYRVDFEEPQ